MRYERIFQQDVSMGWGVFVRRYPRHHFIPLVACPVQVRGTLTPAELDMMAPSTFFSRSYASLASASLLACAAACTESPVDDTAGTGASDASTATTSSITDAAGPVLLSDAGIPVFDAGASKTGDAGAGTSPAASRGLPCDVQKVVDSKCASCHSDPPVGTFMALKTQAQFQAVGTSDKTKKYFELSKVRINSSDKPMPPAPHAPLSAADRATLTAWFDKGAPASAEACASSMAAGADAGAPSVSDGSNLNTDGLECYRFTAHAQGSKTAKFKVGKITDGYYNFGFKAPWTGMLYGVVVRPIIDNGKVLHHWLLYKENVADGSVQTTIGQHGSGELIYGWAPGGTPMDMRTHGDVGFEMPDSTYSVEVHYNSGEANAEDASGVEVCGTKTKPANVAGMTWLGYDQGGTASYATGGGFCLEASTSWTGTCKPQSQEPIHLVYAVPHLHEKGLHLKSVINSPKGQRILVDEPFDFSTQVGYETKEVLMPGETITTTCTFSEPKCAGQGTSQEMCYLFTYAYPKYALSDNGPQGTFMHGKGACLGQ
jgi:hypothetical protein